MPIGNKSCRKAPIGIERSALCGTIRSVSKDDLNTLGREVLQQGRGGLGVCDDGINLPEITEERNRASPKFGVIQAKNDFLRCSNCLLYTSDAADE